MNYLRFQAMGILFASVFPLIVSGADGTWTPVVADRRVTEVRIDSNGDETLLRSHGGEFLRSTDGKQLTTEGKSQPDGSFDLSRATLLDFQQGSRVELLYGNKQIIERDGSQRQQARFTNEMKTRAEGKAVGKKSVNGVSCYGFPVTGGGSGASDSAVTGVGWRSMEYDLPVKTVVEITSAGETVRIVNELYNIRVGQEPDPARFEVPADFRVVPLPDGVSVGASREGPESPVAR